MEKFIQMQKIYYKQAYEEIKAGKKLNHWIWFIFPQIAGLGYSFNSNYYEIKSLDEAKEYLRNNFLRENLEGILKVLLMHEGRRNIVDIMGNPLDAQKLLSSMTLFKIASRNMFYGKENIYSRVINTFFNGKEDRNTINILKKLEYNNIHHNINNNYKIYHPKTQTLFPINYANETRVSQYLNISSNEPYNNLLHDLNETNKEVNYRKNLNNSPIEYGDGNNIFGQYTDNSIITLGCNNYSNYSNNFHMQYANGPNIFGQNINNSVITPGYNSMVSSNGNENVMLVGEKSF